MSEEDTEDHDSDDAERWLKETHKLVTDGPVWRQVQAVHIADGFHVDCNLLLSRCANVRPLRWEDFVGFWKSSHFSYVFKGRPSAMETAELSEELLIIAKSFFVKPENTFWESVAALYLLYGLVYMQPLDMFAQIRLTPSDMRRVLEVETEARRLKQLDVLYCLGRMQIEGMMKPTMHDMEYGLERAIRRRLEGNLMSVENMRLEMGVITQSSSELKLLKEISKSMRDYSDAKDLLNDRKGTDRNLNYCDGELARRLSDSLTTLQRSGTYKKDEVEAASRANIMLHIKDRAMRHEVQAARHRKSIAKKMRSQRRQKPKETLSESEETWLPPKRTRTTATKVTNVTKTTATTVNVPKTTATPVNVPKTIASTVTNVTKTTTTVNNTAATTTAPAARSLRKAKKEHPEAATEAKVEAVTDSTCDSVYEVAMELPAVLLEDSQSQPEPPPAPAPRDTHPGIFGL